MLFGVDFCKRTPVRRRPRNSGVPIKVCAAILCVAVAVGLLFLAPHWLLVLFIMLLAAGLIVALRRCSCR